MTVKNTIARSSMEQFLDAYRPQMDPKDRAALLAGTKCMRAPCGTEYRVGPGGIEYRAGAFLSENASADIARSAMEYARGAPAEVETAFVAEVERVARMSNAERIAHAAAPQSYGAVREITDTALAAARQSPAEVDAQFEAAVQRSMREADAFTGSASAAIAETALEYARGLL